MTCSPNQTSCLPSQTHDLQIMRSPRITLKCVVCPQKSLTRVVCWWRGVPPWYFEVKIFQYCRSIFSTWWRLVAELEQECWLWSPQDLDHVKSQAEPRPHELHGTTATLMVILEHHWATLEAGLSLVGWEWRQAWPPVSGSRPARSWCWSGPTCCCCLLITRKLLYCH